MDLTVKNMMLQSGEQRIMKSNIFCISDNHRFIEWFGLEGPLQII